MTEVLLPKNKVEDLCGISSYNSTLVKEFKFYGCGVTISVLGCAGIIGNILSFVTIATLPKRSLFNKLLLTLTVFDTLFIGNGGIFMVQQAFKFKNSTYNALFPWMIYPLAGIAMTGSTYTCIAIALERFLGICYAHSDIPRHSRYYILAISTISLIIDFPRFFEIHPTVVDGEIRFTFSSLRRNEFYLKFYIFWFRLFATAAIPFILMLFFNLKILIHYRKNSFMNGQNSSSFNNNSHERSLYITFFCLTSTFLVCHLPRILLNINELNINRQKDNCHSAFPEAVYNTPAWTHIASSIEKILLIFNSSVNFVFYCLAGKSFRTHLLKMLLPSSCLRRYFNVDTGTALTESVVYHERTASYCIRPPQRKIHNDNNEELGSRDVGVVINEVSEEDEDQQSTDLIRSCSADLVDVRIQQRQSKSELKLFSDHKLNQQVIKKEPPLSATENELLGIYDIRITIHHKSIGSAI